MNWWECAEWRAFTVAVLAAPDDTTARLVAADWLDERGDATAAARAALIRRQAAAPDEPLLLTPGSGYAAAGFPEPAYARAAGLAVFVGWPRWAAFLPHRFNDDTVGPVFRLAPVTTCSTVGVCAYVAESGVQRPWRFTVNEGPENMLSGQCPDAFGPVMRRMARAGLNPHQEFYREAGLIPAPAFRHLPAAGGSRGRTTDRRTHWASADRCASEVLKAHWRAGREWAGQSPARAPDPNPVAVGMFVRRTHWRDQRGEDGELVVPPPAPSAADDPFSTDPLGPDREYPGPNAAAV
jgi:uncharacterized protein (TIGR02996 family)